MYIRVSRLEFLAFITAFCSILYELLLGQLLSATLGNTFFRYTSTIGIYLAGLGIGSLLFKRYETQSHSKVSKLFFKIEILLSIAGGLSPLAILFIARLFQGTNIFNSEFIGSFLLSTLIYGWIAMIAVLSGFELPSLIRMSESKKQSYHSIIGFDYFGMFIGTILFSFYFIEHYNLFTVATFAGLLNTVVCAFLLLGDKNKLNLSRLKALTALITLIFAVLLYLHEPYSNALSSLYFGVNIER